MINTSAPASQKVVRYTRAGPVLAQVRGQQGVDDVQDQPQRPQAGVPQAEHRRGPAVGDHLAGLAGQILERIEQIVRTHAHSAASTQVRQPARMLSSLPGQVDGACRWGAGGDHPPAVVPLHPFAVAVPDLGLDGDRGAHLEQDAGDRPVRAVDTLTCPAAGTAITPRRQGLLLTLRAASRKAWTLPSSATAPSRHRPAAPSRCRRRWCTGSTCPARPRYRSRRAAPPHPQGARETVGTPAGPTPVAGGICMVGPATAAAWWAARLAGQPGASAPPRSHPVPQQLAGSRLDSARGCLQCHRLGALVTAYVPAKTRPATRTATTSRATPSIRSSRPRPQAAAGLQGAHRVGFGDGPWPPTPLTQPEPKRESIKPGSTM